MWPRKEELAKRVPQEGAEQEPGSLQSLGPARARGHRTRAKAASSREMLPTRRPAAAAGPAVSIPAVRPTLGLHGRALTSAEWATGPGEQCGSHGRGPPRPLARSSTVPDSRGRGRGRATPTDPQGRGRYGGLATPITCRGGAGDALAP